MPQIHLPNFRFVLLRPPPYLKPTQALFEVPRYLNKIDIKNYLSSVYQVQVEKVHTVVPPRRRILHPRAHLFHKHPHQRPFMWMTMKKKAYVFLKEPFIYPAMPDQVKTQKEYVDKSKEKKVETRKLQSSMFTSKFDLVLKHRYMGNEPEQLPPVPESLLKPLENLKLDPLHYVKGQAKNRVIKSRQHRNKGPREKYWYQFK